MQSRRNNPCYECQERTIGCHSDCERYKVFRDAIDSANENKRKMLTIHYEYYTAYAPMRGKDNGTKEKPKDNG